MSFNYANYVNSFYSNDPVILQKRRTQSKIYGTVAATMGTIGAGLTLLPGNKLKLLTGMTSLFLLLGALNTHNYVKQADKKLAQLNVNA